MKGPEAPGLLGAVAVNGRGARGRPVPLEHDASGDRNAAGTAIMPKQTIELSREFTFDASQALGVSAETDLLTKELQRDMVQAILRRLEARAKAPSN